MSLLHTKSPSKLLTPASVASSRKEPKRMVRGAILPQASVEARNCSFNIFRICKKGSLVDSWWMSLKKIPKALYVLIHVLFREKMVGPWLSQARAADS
jgi:hypothetical protein